MSKEICSKNDIQKTATGYVTDSVCTVGGMSMTSHSEVTGDFNSAYTVKVTSHSQGGPAGAPRDTDHDAGSQMARRLQGGPEARRHRDARRHSKMNVKDMEKMKGDDAEVGAAVQDHLRHPEEPRSCATSRSDDRKCLWPSFETRAKSALLRMTAS